MRIHLQKSAGSASASAAARGGQGPCGEQAPGVGEPPHAPARPQAHDQGALLPGLPGWLLSLFRVTLPHARRVGILHYVL